MFSFLRNYKSNLKGDHSAFPPATNRTSCCYTFISAFGIKCIWHPTPVLLPGKSHGRRSLVGCSPWGHEESDTYWATWLSLFTFMHWRRKWQPTPVFLPGESQGQGTLVGCRLWGRTQSDTTEGTSGSDGSGSSSSSSGISLFSIAFPWWHTIESIFTYVCHLTSLVRYLLCSLTHF